MDINVDLLQWSINVLIKRFLTAVLKMKLFILINWPKNYTNQFQEKKSTVNFYRQNLRQAGWTDLADMQLTSTLNEILHFY